MKSYVHDSAMPRQAAFAAWRELLLVMLFIPFGHSVAEATSDKKHTTGFEELKAFIANPPKSGELVFSYQQHIVSSVDKNNTPVIKSDPPLFYRVRWAQDYLSIQEDKTIEALQQDLFSPEFVLDNSNVLIQNKTNFWAISGRASNVVRWSGEISYPLDLQNPIHVRYYAMTQPWLTTMNMGAHFVPQGRIDWSTNSFRLVSTPLNTEFTISGEILEATNGFTRAMNIRYQSLNAFGKYLVLYNYALQNSLPSFFPSEISSRIVSTTPELPDKTINILAANFDLSLEPPNPEPWLMHRSFARLEVFGHETYEISPTGEMRLLTRTSQPPSPPFLLPNAHRYYYILSVLTTLILLRIGITNTKLQRQTEI